MKKTSESIIVQLATPERKYAKIYHDFLDNTFLTAEEQLVFIVLKSFVDFRGDSGDTFPSMETICKRAKMSEKRARKNIESLTKKGIVKKKRRGLTKTNVYTLADFAPMWKCDNVEDVAAAANGDGLTAEQHIEALRRMGNEVEIIRKEKEPASDSDQTTEADTPKNTFILDKDSTDKEKSQGEQYSEQYIKQYFNYSVLMTEYPQYKNDFEVVFDILYDVLNRTKPTIRVGGEERPSDRVKEKLKRLDYYDIAYAVEMYHQQRGEIGAVKPYLLTLLYNVRGQAYLSLMNKGHVNGDF